MTIGAFCGVVPFFLRGKKISRFRRRLLFRRRKASMMNMESYEVETSCGVTEHFLTVVEVKNKLSTFRNLLDLSPCIASASVTELLLLTVNDLHKRYPCIKPDVSVPEIQNTVAIHKALRFFCDTLKSLEKLWTIEDGWTKYRYESSKELDCTELEQIALEMLDDMIKLAGEKMFDMMSDEKGMREYSYQDESSGRASLARSEAYSDERSCSPETPTSVLSEAWKAMTQISKTSYSAPLLLPLRVQAIKKLNPIDVRHLLIYTSPRAVDLDPKYSVQLHSKENSEVIVTDINGIDQESGSVENIDEANGHKNELKDDSTVLESKTLKLEDVQHLPIHILSCAVDLNPKYSMQSSKTDAKQHSEVIVADLDGINQDSEIVEKSEVVNEQNIEVENESPNIRAGSEEITGDGERNRIDTTGIQSLPTPAPASCAEASINVSQRPSTLNLPEPAPSPTSEPSSPRPLLPSTPPPSPRKPKELSPPPPPPPPAYHKSENISAPHVLPLPMESTSNSASLPAPSPMSACKVVAVPPPPTGMLMVNKRAPPPPPGFGGAKDLRSMKATSKLKRSSQMGNLYRVLRGKIEGSSSDGKSSERRNKLGSTSGGKQGMADALAEMAKRSTYFQQIEADIKDHAELIMKVKAAICSFQTSDMVELLKFHKNVEFHLEKLTDESQVLARFEDFPTKKLEALRMAAALHSKLDAIVSTLQNWPMVSPVRQLLNKAESYFSKIKEEIDALERTKDEEAKKLLDHKIKFDFGILVRIKELTVDLSSNCMELALKEKREAATKGSGQVTCERKNSTSEKILWKAFQFAFRVYTFAGGHDDRADKLTRELAHEIEIDTHH